MNKLTTFVCCLGLALGCIALPGDAFASNDVFLGNWTSIDTDGSHQTLAVRGSAQSAKLAMKLHDDFTSGVCGGAPAALAGTGTADGDELTMTGALTCRPGGNLLGFRVSMRFTYDSGVLVDESGVVWTRST